MVARWRTALLLRLRERRDHTGEDERNRWRPCTGDPTSEGSEMSLDLRRSGKRHVQGERGDFESRPRRRIPPSPASTTMLKGFSEIHFGLKAGNAQSEFPWRSSGTGRAPRHPAPAYYPKEAGRAPSSWNQGRRQLPGGTGTFFEARHDQRCLLRRDRRPPSRPTSSPRGTGSESRCSWKARP